jgi:hypothetical protein
VAQQNSEGVADRRRGWQVGVVAVWWTAPPPRSRLEAMRVGAHGAGLVIEIEMSEGSRGKRTHDA